MRLQSHINGTWKGMIEALTRQHSLSPHAKPTIFEIEWKGKEKGYPYYIILHRKEVHDVDLSLLACLWFQMDAEVYSSTVQFRITRPKSRS